MSKQKSETPRTNGLRLFIAAGDLRKESDCTQCALAECEKFELEINQLRADLKQCAETLKTVYNVLETCKNNKRFWGEVLFTDHVSPAINNPRIQAILNEK